MVRVGNPEKELLRQTLNKLEGLALWVGGKKHLGKRSKLSAKLQTSHMSGIFEEQQVC